MADHCYSSITRPRWPPIPRQTFDPQRRTTDRAGCGQAAGAIEKGMISARPPPAPSVPSSAAEAAAAPLARPPRAARADRAPSPAAHRAPSLAAHRAPSPAAHRAPRRARNRLNHTIARSAETTERADSRSGYFLAVSGGRLRPFSRVTLVTKLWTLNLQCRGLFQALPLTVRFPPLIAFW